MECNIDLGPVYQKNKRKRWKKSNKERILFVVEYIIQLTSLTMIEQK